MIAFIDDHREAYGVEPICRVLPIAPSSYFERVAQRNDPARLSARAKRDLELKPEVVRVCTVERLMRGLGLHGVIRAGKPFRTTVSDKAAPCPLDHVNRQFRAPAPNCLWPRFCALLGVRLPATSKICRPMLSRARHLQDLRNR